MARFVIVKECKLVEVHFVEAASQEEAVELANREGSCPHTSAYLDSRTSKVVPVLRFPVGALAYDGEGTWICDENGEPAALERA